MKQQGIKQLSVQSSRLIYGCMRIVDTLNNDVKKAHQSIEAALAHGYNHFDHADIYADGATEQAFGKYLAKFPSLRDRIILTSKAGIKKASKDNTIKHYDFSAEYLLTSVEASLKRLKTDYLDMFLLHRPDYLMDVEQVAEAFYQLKRRGMVKHFGVSNFSPSQFSLLQSACDLPLLVNQIEINLHNIKSLNDGTLDMCQQLGVTPMAWCPIAGIAYPAWGNTFSAEQEARLLIEVKRQAEVYHCAQWLIPLAWLLKHPAKIYPIIGSTDPSRIAQAQQALTIEYTREDWYRLLAARNGVDVP